MEAFGAAITKQDVFNKVVGVQMSLVRVVILCAITGVIGGLISRCISG